MQSRIIHALSTADICTCCCCSALLFIYLSLSLSYTRNRISREAPFICARAQQLDYYTSEQVYIYVYTQVILTGDTETSVVENIKVYRAISTISLSAVIARCLLVPRRVVYAFFVPIVRFRGSHFPIRPSVIGLRPL